MRFSSSSSVAFFTNIILTDTIRTDARYIIYRQTGSGEAQLEVNFISGNNNTIKIKKTSTTYDGCTRLRIFGIK